MSFLLGLTGSIGMGKSTTAAMFRDAGCALWDADAAVHRLYGPGGAAVAPLAAAFPDAVQDGQVSRPALKVIIAQDPTALGRIEAIVHPLVGQDRADFIAGTTADIVVFDIPLLFEGGMQDQMDATAVVTTTSAEQRARVLARGTMSAADFDLILARQMPDADKRTRATYIIETDTLDHARQQVLAIVDQIRGASHA
ncbi:dephospho-CoA kinase [Pseudooceanicola algae]|uniref:Dephospho-CoA kinase n=1 Tax=Pseudooceanicola algae TaxID=1537215 RepID=A0A418SBH8_9RHOB|nr:dephospho-CoA kinase [Pseudooceanicola algae]QPM91478.1 Dephospho-CoA kinase [Pseudooceanicola algae]